MFNTSTVWKANYRAEEEIIVNQGGTDSGKTYAIMQLLFWYAITLPAPAVDPIITVVGESIPNLKKGAYRTAESIYANTPGLEAYVIDWNKTERTIKFINPQRPKFPGWKMEFTSCENEQAARNGKRQFLFINEAQGVSYPIFWQLCKRTRRQTFIDYNPSAPFWAHEKLIGKSMDNDFNKSVRTFISDHRHNLFLTDAEHRQTENIKDPELWRVYARGLTGNLQGLIFPTWVKIADEMFPDDEDNIFGGLDFGYTNDETAGVKCCRVGNNIYVKELCYKTGLSPKQLNRLFRAEGFDEDKPIYCEHDGDMIRQLRMDPHNLMAVAARKGPGSIKAGILKINKDYNIYYTESSKNIDMERKKYMWEKDPDTGKSINVPVDKINHLMDAIRYAIYTNFYRQQ